MKKKYDIAITVGVFDTFHKGHFQLLEYMNELADWNYIILHDNYSTFENKQRIPIQNLEQRTENIRDVVNRSDLNNILCNHCCLKNPGDELNILINKLKKNRKDFNEDNPNEAKDLKIVYIRGDDWQDFPGKEVLEKHNIPIIFKPYTKGISSSLIRENLIK